MTKRRRLTKIRVPQTSFTIEDRCPSNDTFTSFRTEEGCNMNSYIDNDVSRSLMSHADEITSSDSDTTDDPQVKCRGPTLLTDIWNQPPEERCVVKFNKQGQPYGDDSISLSSFIGTIARNPELAPQGYSDWRLVPKEYKDRCMNEIKLRFAFPRRGEDHIRKALGRTVKDFRGELKAMYYEPNKHNRTNLVNAKPSRLPKDQWLKLISYWDQDKTKRRAAINRINQKNQSMPHCAGRQSFAQLRAKKTIDGVEPSRAQIFIDTHKDRKTRDKQKIDEESAKAVELMKEKLQELPDGREQSNGKIAWKDDIFDQVIGKEEIRGRVRGVGGGICAAKLWGTSNTHQTFDSLESNGGSGLVNKLLDDIKVMQEDARVTREKHSEEMKMILNKQKESEEKQGSELKEVLEKQNRLESHIQELLRLFIAKASAHNSKSTEIVSNNTSG